MAPINSGLTKHEYRDCIHFTTTGTSNTRSPFPLWQYDTETEHCLACAGWDLERALCIMRRLVGRRWFVHSGNFFGQDRLAIGLHQRVEHLCSATGFPSRVICTAGSTGATRRANRPILSL